MKTYPSIFNLPTISLTVAKANIIQPEANIIQPEANIIQPEANIIQPEANIIFLALWPQLYELTHQFLIFQQYLSQLQRPISYNQRLISHCCPNCMKTYPSIFDLPTISLTVAEANIIQPEANIIQPEANIIQPEANIIQLQVIIIFLPLWPQLYEDLPINNESSYNISHSCRGQYHTTRGQYHIAAQIV